MSTSSANYLLPGPSSGDAPDGATQITALATAVDTALGGAFVKKLPTVFTASGTLASTAYPNAKAFRIEGCNGGSGSGGTAATGAATVAVSGAGAGAPSAVKTVLVSALTFPLTVTVGAGGAAGAANGNGGVGGTSSVTNGATTYWSPGASSASSIGLAGAASGTPGQGGSFGFVSSGTAPTADYSIAGGIPGDGVRLSTTAAAGVSGGSSAYGNGGYRGNNGAGAGVGFGGGGGCTVAGPSQAALVGAGGGGGIIIISPVY